MILPDLINPIVDFETISVFGSGMVPVASSLMEAGFQFLQLRDKQRPPELRNPEYREIARLAGISGCTLVINDLPYLASELGCWAHIGADDPLPDNPELPYGLTVHDPADLARVNPATMYIGFGAMFASMTKPHVKINSGCYPEVRRLYAGPIVLIGGITLENVNQLPAGYQSVAVIRDLFRYGVSSRAFLRYRNEFLEIQKLRSDE